MVTQYKVVTSPKEPEVKNVLWLKDNKLYYYNGGWEQLYKNSSIGGGPTKLSELKNDVGFITSKDIPKYDLTKYYTKEEINTNYQPKGDYALKTDIPSVPTKVSELTNDNGFITLADVPKTDLSGYAKTTDIPTKVSELANDKAFATTNDVVTAIGGKADKVLVIEETATSLAITPNVLHKWGEVATLDITLAEPTDLSIVNEYMIEFVSGATATTLTLPNVIEWAIEPKIEANKTYQISIVDNIAVIIGV